MLSPALPIEIFLCLEPTDLRCGFDRLTQRAAEEHRADGGPLTEDRIRRGGL